MAKPKLNFAPAPTFCATVQIIGQGAPAPVPVEFTFRYRTKDQAIAWEAEEIPALHAKGGNVAVLQSMATGWDQDPPFDADNLALFDQCYMGAIKQIRDEYKNCLLGARLGN